MQLSFGRNPKFTSDYTKTLLLVCFSELSSVLFEQFLPCVFYAHLLPISARPIPSIVSIASSISFSGARMSHVVHKKHLSGHSSLYRVIHSTFNGESSDTIDFLTRCQKGRPLGMYRECYVDFFEDTYKSAVTGDL